MRYAKVFQEILNFITRGEYMKTEDIEEKIRRTKRLDMKMIADNPPPEFSDFLQQLINEHGIKKSALIKALNIDRNYGYQILNGTRTPARNQVIRIALFLQLNFKQTQRLLNLAGREALYVRRPEDAKAVHCLEHPMDFRKACLFIWGDTE